MIEYYKVTSLETLKPRLRLIPMLVTSVSGAAFLWILVSQRGETRTILVAGLMIIMIWGALRFYKEKSILQNMASAIGEVIEQRKESSSDGGYDYEARYQFTAADGIIYVGNSGGTIKELPKQGGRIFIFYNKKNPRQNLPRELFWFYKA
jgi:hypothetical protein